MRKKLIRVFLLKNISKNSENIFKAQFLNKSSANSVAILKQAFLELIKVIFQDSHKTLFSNRNHVMLSPEIDHFT